MNVDETLARAELPDVDPDLDSAFASVTRLAGRRKRRRVVAASSAVAAVLLVSVLVVAELTGPSKVDVAADDADGVASTSVPLDQETDGDGLPSAEDERWVPDVMGSGGFTGARTSGDGRTVLLTFIGGPPYRAGEHCTVAYRVTADEQPTMVTVQLFSYSPPAPEMSLCTGVGYSRSLEASLSEPLGARELIEAGSGLRLGVFDGSLIAVPGWLPEGWDLRYEQAGYPDPQTSSSWTQTWGPPPPPPTERGCAPSDGGISLTQGPLGGAHRELVSLDPVSTHDVGGASATYHVGGPAAPGVVALVWDSAGQTLVLSSSPSCGSGGTASLGRLMRFANELFIPSR